MIGAILGGATALASAISSIANFAQAKKDTQSAEAAANRLMGMKVVDEMAALQSPDVSSLMLQQTSQQAASATQALQGMGAEAAIGGVANLQQNINQDIAKATTEQAAIDAETAQIKAQAAQAVAEKNLGMEREIEMMRLTGAQTAAAERRQAGMAGIEGIAAGVGIAAKDLYGSSSPYGKKKK